MVCFNELGTKKFFRKHASADASLRTQIAQMLEKQFEMGFSKVKPASHLRFNGNKVWELRVNPAQIPPIRVAFTVVDDQFEVIYLTHAIQKSEFTRELELFLRG